MIEKGKKDKKQSVHATTKNTTNLVIHVQTGKKPIERATIPMRTKSKDRNMRKLEDKQPPPKV